MQVAAIDGRFISHLKVLADDNNNHHNQRLFPVFDWIEQRG